MHTKRQRDGAFLTQTEQRYYSVIGNVFYLTYTIVPLKAAISLYKKHGFEECEAYYHNPMDDVIYMRKEL